MFFRFLFDGTFGRRVLDAWKGPAVLPPGSPPASREDSAPALHLLAILQREGRLVDFLQEDIAGFSDAEVGAAARVVHEGCRHTLSEYISFEPVRTEGEGATITVEAGFDPAAFRLTGQVTGKPPFTGALRHHGWRATSVRLPAPMANVDARIVAPAEVEL